MVSEKKLGMVTLNVLAAGNWPFRTGGVYLFNASCNLIALFTSGRLPEWICKLVNCPSSSKYGQSKFPDNLKPCRNHTPVSTILIYTLTPKCINLKEFHLVLLFGWSGRYLFGGLSSELERQVLGATDINKWLKRFLGTQSQCHVPHWRESKLHCVRTGNQRMISKHVTCEQADVNSMVTWLRAKCDVQACSGPRHPWNNKSAYQCPLPSMLE